MDPRSVLATTFAIGVALAIGSGCASNPCPPCEAVAASAGEAKSSGGEPVSGEYYALPGLDHGLLQSPVNILSDETEPGKHKIKFGGADEAEEVANLGTTVELSFGRGITTEFDGKVYELLQLHFHTPAEHLIDGITIRWRCTWFIDVRDRRPSTRPPTWSSRFSFEWVRQTPSWRNSSTRFRRNQVKR